MLSPIDHLFLYALANALRLEDRFRIRWLFFCGDVECCGLLAAQNLDRTICQDMNFIEISCADHAPVLNWFIDVRLVRDLMHHFKEDFDVSEDQLKGYLFDPWNPASPLETVLLNESETPYMEEFQRKLEDMWTEACPCENFYSSFERDFVRRTVGRLLGIELMD
jgi:hypothetical protein